MFNIPVWGRSGNGYIFDSDYTNAEKAKEEVEAFLGQEIEVGKQINFDPGALDRVWIKNCCAIGISASFVEPLEATSIGTSIRQAFLLMHRLPNYTEKTIEKYNKDVNDILTNIRDFVVLHYVTKKDNSQFWRDIQKLELPDTLAENLERWKSNLPIEEDFANMTQYTMFKSDNFIQILNGLSLFDREKIRNEYMLQHPELRILADDKLREVLTYEKIAPKIGHKKFISLIRNNKL
jgi:tryptophan halogenase